MRLALVALLLPAVAAANPTPLTSTVTRAALEPAVVIVPMSAGHTTVERYRSAEKPVSGTPLAVIVRLADANSPDVIAVKDAHRDGQKISIALDTRRFDGPLAGNVVTTPFVEIALGNLPSGTYTIDILEQISHFTKLDAPQTAKNAHRGLDSSVTLTIQ
jgi:hypothetical protein